MIFKMRSAREISVLIIAALIVVLAFPVIAQESSEEEHTVGVELAVDGLTSPVDMAMPDDGSGRIFIVDQVGPIWILAPNGELMSEPFLDLSDKIVELNPDYDERGVLGLAFHPDYDENGRFFVYYTIPLREDAPEDWAHTNVVSEFSVSSDNPDQADPDSERIIWEHDHPSSNHNAGHITFGPDGYLYIPYGDGGGADDTGRGHTPDIGNGQDVTNLFGTILRIDMDTDDSGEPYAIPEDNPFVDNDDVPDEIYAYGFRNPFDITFDEERRLFVSDAGQNLYEEISIVESGGNYGWNIKEGAHCFSTENPDEAPEECPDEGPVLGNPLIDPIVEYSHDYGIVVVGALMYRGSELSNMEGHMIFADYAASSRDATGVLFWAEPSDDDGLWEWGELYVNGMEDNRIGEFILALGEDQDGEIYVMTKENTGPTGNTGKVWRLVSAEMDES